MLKSFYRELARRIVTVQPDPALEDYGQFVHIVRRYWFQMSIEELAELAKLREEEKEVIFFLENNMARANEVSNALRQKIESALGITYDEFKQS